MQKLQLIAKIANFETKRRGRERNRKCLACLHGFDILILIENFVIEFLFDTNQPADSIKGASINYADIILRIFDPLPLR